MDGDSECNCSNINRIEMEDNIDEALHDVRRDATNNFDTSYTNHAIFKPVDRVETGVDGVFGIEDTFSEKYRIFQERLRKEVYNEVFYNVTENNNYPGILIKEYALLNDIKEIFGDFSYELKFDVVLDKLKEIY